MTAEGVDAGRWVLDRDSFERLLRRLDSDPDRAGEKYERIRHKLARFFEWRGDGHPDEAVDQVLDHVARRLAEGEEILAGDPGHYFHGVALHVLQERRRRDSARAAAVPPPAPGVQPDQEQLDCLTRCLGELSAEDRSAVSDYYVGAGQGRIERRFGLAARLGLSQDALRIRLHRLRLRLAACVRACVGDVRG